MKKPLAIVLLILGGFAGIFGLSLVNLILFGNLLSLGNLVGLILTASAAFGIDGLRVLFARKYGLSAPKFFLCAYVPSVTATLVYFTVVLYLDSVGYFTGFFAGLGEFIMGLAWLATSAVAIIFGFIIFAIKTHFYKERKQNER